MVSLLEDLVVLLLEGVNFGDEVWKAHLGGSRRVGLGDGLHFLEGHADAKRGAGRKRFSQSDDGLLFLLGGKNNASILEKKVVVGSSVYEAGGFQKVLEEVKLSLAHPVRSKLCLECGEKRHDCALFGHCREKARVKMFGECSHTVHVDACVGEGQDVVEFLCRQGSGSRSLCRLLFGRVFNLGAGSQSLGCRSTGGHAWGGEDGGVGVLECLEVVV